MRPIVLGAWKDQVVDSMRKELPQFDLVKKHEPGDEKNLMKFAWITESGLLCAVAFRALDEAFDVYLGWSVDGKFPYSTARRNGFHADVWDFGQTSVMVPLIMLLERGVASWSFWNPPDDLVDRPEEFAKAFAEYYSAELAVDEARALVAESTHRAVLEFADVGVKYLRRRIDWRSARSP